MALLGTEAMLDATAQNHLLDSVTAVFTEKDNAMLEAETLVASHLTCGHLEKYLCMDVWITPTHLN